MRTLAVTQNITLDGRIEMLGDWFDPSASDPEQHAELMRQSADEEILLLGRQTFEDFRGYWPHQVDDRTGITAHLNRVRKHVVSTTLGDPGWENSVVVDGDPVAAARELRAGEGGDIVVTGSIRLTHTLLSAGVVDELRLFTYPVVQGRGRSLFPEGFARSLRLRQSRGYDSGVTYAVYDLEPDPD